jgi:hypothetical protein
MLQSNWKIITTLAICISVYFFAHHEGFLEGQADTQGKWNNEENAEKKASDEAKQHDKEAHDAQVLQHQKDIDAVKTQAGRTAIDGYIATHSLLPNGFALHSQQPGNHDQTNCAGGTDATTAKLGIGESSQSIREFTERCASDALTLMRWQEWATAEQLPVK